jgi:hypothetical protein
LNGCETRLNFVCLFNAKNYFTVIVDILQIFSRFLHIQNEFVFSDDKMYKSSNLPSTRKVLLTFFRYTDKQLGKFFLADTFFRVCFSARALRARKIYKAQQLFLTSTAS